MTEVLYLPEVRTYFKDVTQILYQKGYFGFKESAKKYVQELFNEIDLALPHKQKRKAPAYFSRYGDDLYYAGFRKNNNTQWYVFFTIHKGKDNKIYLVRYIGNNHTISQYL